MLALGRQLWFELDRFVPLLDPALLARFGHVHVLGTDGVGVHALEDLDDFTQRQAVIAAGQRAGVEHRFQIFRAKAVMRRKIGRASWRERVCPYVWYSVVAG